MLWQEKAILLPTFIFGLLSLAELHTWEKSHPTCLHPDCYAKLFPFATHYPPPKNRMRRTWIIVVFQGTIMNFISVQSILHEFARGLYSELAYVLQSCHLKLHRVVLNGSFLSLVWLFTFLGEKWVSMTLDTLWWKSI